MNQIIQHLKQREETTELFKNIKMHIEVSHRKQVIDEIEALVSESSQLLLEKVLEVVDSKKKGKEYFKVYREDYNEALSDIRTAILEALNNKQQ